MNTNDFNDQSRRAFVQRAANTFLGLSVAPVIGSSVAQAADAGGGKAKHVIYIYLSGGMSHLDTLDPKPGSESQGPTQSISTVVPGVQLSEHMAGLAKQMDKATIIRSMTTTQGAHERGRYLAHTSYPPIATTRHASLGSWVYRMLSSENATLPGNVLIDGPSDHAGAGFMDSKYAPLPIGDPTEGLKHSTLPGSVTESRFSRRLRMASQLDSSFRTRYPHKAVRGYSDFYDDAVKLMKSKDLAAFDISKERAEIREAYGETKIGQAALLASRLVQHGVRFIEINNGGWDTHRNNFEELPEKATELDTALSTLLQDLTASGLLDSTLVVVATEFGRTPKINDFDGRDHHPAVFSTLLAGGGVKGGYVHGESDKRGYGVAEDKVGMDDFNATIAAAMGLQLDHTLMSPSGRPFTVAHKGKPVQQVFA